MRAIISIIFCFFLYNGFSQEIVKIYNPDGDVASAINEGIIKAKGENKHIFLQIGGNWCSWCRKFHKICAEDPDIKAQMDKNYITIRVNYSKENRNLEALKKLEYPQRFGFPVFVILDSNGKRIHTQSSSYLEEGDGYSTKKIIEFLNQWSPEALNSGNYKEK